MGSELLAVDGAWYRHPGRRQPTLTEISFRVQRTSLTLVMGTSGAGKSTLFSLLCGLLPLEQDHCGGRVTLNGVEHVIAPGFTGVEVGLLLQEPARQLHQLTVRDELLSAPAYRGLPWEECQRRADAVAGMLLTPELVGARTDELSTGQQQLVALASLLTADFDLLILDEPFSYLDGTAILALLDVLDRIRDAGKTLIVSGHDLTYLAPRADDALVLIDGTIRIHDAPRAVYYDAEFAELVGEPPAITAARAAGHADHRPINWDEVAERTENPAVHPLDATRSGRSAVALQNVTVRRGARTVLDDVTFDLRLGEAIAIVGGNGSGKTTLLRTILGQLPYDGSISVAERDLASYQANQLAASLGWVPQNPADIFFESTAEEELSFGPEMLDRPLGASRIDALLATVGLAGKAKVHPRTLSAGQQRLLTIAIALANDPRILLVDEPEFGLDQNTYRNVAGVLAALIRGGVSALVVTHSLEVAFSLCSRLVILEKGGVAWEGSAREAASSIPRALRTIALPQRGLDLLAAVSVTMHRD